MGSRKKKIEAITERKQFLKFYRGLTIHERLAFKSFIYHYGRARYTLQELLCESPKTLWWYTSGHYVEYGYTWMHDPFTSSHSCKVLPWPHGARFV